MNNNFMYLGTDSISKLDNIEATLKQNPIDQSVFDDAYREFIGIINLIQNFEDTKPIYNKFNPLFRDAKDRLKIQNLSFSSFWTAEILALALNVYLLPNVLIYLNTRDVSKPFGVVLISIEVTFIASTISAIGLKNSTHKDKNKHIALITVWVVLSFVVCLISYMKYFN